MWSTSRKSLDSEAGIYCVLGSGGGKEEEEGEKQKNEEEKKGEEEEKVMEEEPACKQISSTAQCLS